MHPPGTKREQLFSAAKHTDSLLKWRSEEDEMLWEQKFINAFLSSQARSQRTFLWIIQCSEIRLVKNGGLCLVLSCHLGQWEGFYALWWDASERAAMFPHSNSLFHTREMANDSPTCVIPEQCPEKQSNLVSMTEGQLAKDLLHRIHKWSCKSAPRCLSFPSLLQNTYFAENCYFPFFFPHSRGDCHSPRQQVLTIFLWPQCFHFAALPNWDYINEA